MTRKPAFTLVELLVVVAIIVVLLALLVPGMQKAMYRAQLAVCAAQQHTTASGVHAYAFDHKRYYPDRKLSTPRNASDHFPVTMLAGADTPESNHPPVDIRPQFKGYVQINKQLRDPFVGEVDLEFQDAAHDVTAIGSYAMWFGWYYKNGARPLVGMTKLGDSWDFAWNSGPKRTYSLLLSDVDLTWSGQNNISASHPDAGGGGKPRLWLGVQNDFFAPTYGIRTFQSWWVWNFTINGKTAERDLMDTNFAYDDESVQQLNGYAYQDERYDTVRYFLDTLPDYKVHIPRR